MAHKVNRINTKITEEERELKDNDVRFWNTVINYQSMFASRLSVDP